MKEEWIIEMIGQIKDVARSHAMGRLAEHLDDAILIAASEFHDRRHHDVDVEVAHGYGDSAPFRGPAGPRLQ
jgi:hypothetical protein